jgi:hypothetical protein
MSILQKIVHKTFCTSLIPSLRTFKAIEDIELLSIVLSATFIITEIRLLVPRSLLLCEFTTKVGHYSDYFHHMLAEVKYTDSLVEKPTGFL